VIGKGALSAQNFYWKKGVLCANLSAVNYDVKLPKLGEGADSGVVVNVFVKEGDHVVKDQAILELENEKAVASIPSTAAGSSRKIYVKAGDKISIGSASFHLSGGDQPADAPRLPRTGRAGA